MRSYFRSLQDCKVLSYFSSLPSSQLDYHSATVAGDRQVRVFDIERALTTVGSGREDSFNTWDVMIRKMKCHFGRTKRIVAESSDLFLTVAEVRYFFRNH